MKITSLKIQKNNNEIINVPIGVEAKNVNWLGTASLVDVLGQPYKVYNSVEQMKKDNIHLSVGKCVKTLGYYSRYDGGGAEYIIDAYKKEFSIQLPNSLKANMIIPSNGIINVLQCGIKKDGTSSEIGIKQLLNKNSYVHGFYFPRGIYTFPNENFTINGNINIYGDGEETIFQSQRQYKVIFNGNAKIEDVKLMGGLDLMSKDRSKFKYKEDIYRT